MEELENGSTGLVLIDMFVTRIRYHAKKLNNKTKMKIFSQNDNLKKIKNICDDIYFKRSVDRAIIPDLITQLKELLLFVSNQKESASVNHNKNIVIESLNTIVCIPELLEDN